MKITNKDEVLRKIYYEVEGEIDVGNDEERQVKIIYGKLIAFWDDNDTHPTYTFNFDEKYSEVELTKKQIDEFQELAINN